MQARVAHVALWVGYGLIVAGVSLWSVPAGLIVAGVVLFAAGAAGLRDA